MSQDNVLVENIKSFAAGGVGGVAAVITGHPFDLLKVLIQSKQYPTTLTAFKGILAKDGPRGLYRGVLPPLIGVTPIFAVSFWGYDMGKKIVSSEFVASKFGNAAGAPLTIGQVSLAGFLSAIPTTLVMAPVERVKVVLQTQTPGSQTSMGAAVSQILKSGGIQSLFKGSLATLARDGPGSALYFATYEYTKKFLSSGSDKELSIGAIVMAGGLAGTSMWLGVFPVDTIKTRMTFKVGENISMGEAIKEIYGKQGIKGFYPGLGPALMRSFPANAATFLGVEFAKNMFEKYL